MIRKLLLLISSTDPAEKEKIFFYIQILFGVAVAALFYFMGQRRHESSFRVREADKKKPGTHPTGKRKPEEDRLANAKIHKKEPLSLPGIRINGEPHEILGVPRDATSKQIQSAYRDLMKRYHPDVVGPPGSREWTDAQKIAEAINGARNQMIAAQSQSPKRSGR